MYPFWLWSGDLEKAEIEWQIREMAEWAISAAEDEGLIVHRSSHLS